MRIMIRRPCASHREWPVSSNFASGKKAIAVCDRCGFQYKLKELRSETVKLKRVNNLVCKACWSPDHPQLQVGMFPIDDPQALREARPDNTYAVSGISSGGSRQIQWGWNPVGGASQITMALTPNTLALQLLVGNVTVSTT